MSGVNFILLSLIVLIHFYDVNATFRVNKTIHNDLLTKDIVTYFNHLKGMNNEELKLSDEISNIPDFQERMKKARKLHPKLYKALLELNYSIQSHTRSIDNRDANYFYTDYVTNVMETEIQSGSIDENYAMFIKDELFKFNELDKDAQDAFVTEFPEIGKILENEKILQKKRNAIVSNAEKRVEFTTPKNGKETRVWRQLTLFG